MENMNEILDELVAKLLTDGEAEFSKDGLNIKTAFNNGCLSLKFNFESPVQDNRAENLSEEFKKYVNSLSDEFFVEVAESFDSEELGKIQKKIESKNYDTVVEGVQQFMSSVKAVALSKVKELNKDIENAEKELSELIEIRDSYDHVLNKKF